MSDPSRNDRAAENFTTTPRHILKPTCCKDMAYSHIVVDESYLISLLEMDLALPPMLNFEETRMDTA